MAATTPRAVGSVTLGGKPALTALARSLASQSASESTGATVDPVSQLGKGVV